MSAIFGFIFFIIIILLVIGLSIISRVLGFMSGLWPRKKAQNATSSNSRYGNDRTKNAPNPPKSKKIFDDDEGEYVDFEEIKVDEPHHHPAH